MNVMLCKDFDKTRAVYPCAVSPKIDGVRAFYSPGDTFLISRNQKPIWGMDHLITQLAKLKMPIDMELTVPGMEFNQLSGIIRNHQVTPEVTAHIIDTPIPGATWTERRSLLKQAMQTAQWTDAMATAFWLIPHYKVNSETELQIYYKRFIVDNYEGAVIKTFDHHYRNTRSFDWMRIVPSVSIDVKVLKIYEGEGKMKGIAGGFYFMYNNQLCKCGTMLGLTYGDRFDMWVSPNEYIGRTAIVEFKELQPSGKPRQPRFKGWRYDK